MTRSKKHKHKKKTAGIVSALDLDAEFPNNLQSHHLDTLFDEAEAAVDSFNYDEAECKLNEVLSIDSNNIKALEMLAGIFIEQLKWSDAQKLLKQCIDLCPETGYSKYFSLGQLCEGKESLSYYNKGIQIIEKELENDENVEPSKEAIKKSLLRNISDAYCSVAELFMTDCCFEENAEERCFTAIDCSVKHDPSNPEAHQCLANYYLVKQQIQEAKQAIEKSLSLWLPLHEALRDGEEEPGVESNTENLIPGYDSRIKTSKLLIELEMFSEGSTILEGLLEEDDEIVEVWYLLGWLNYVRGDEYKKNAHFFLKKAKEVSIKTGMDNDECVSHIQELLEELNSAYPLSDENEEYESDIEDFDSDLSSDSENNKMET